MEFEVQKMIFYTVGGLGIFLLGMKNMSEGMQAVAGERIRKMINLITNNRIMACALGTLVTCVIQSSSITTVMVVGMVNAGLMNLMQAIGVILGANIGTTITGWILAFKISKYGLLILGVSSFVYMFSKRDRIRFLGMFFLGLGMVFFGLEMMADGFAPLKHMDGFQEWFQRFEPNTYIGVLKCCAVGAMLTAIVQSSSATLGITIALAMTGAISFQTGAALVLGENIGTTITALLASIGTSSNARRAALAHTTFNVIGVFWITLIFHQYIRGVTWFVHLTDGVLPNAPVYTDTGVSYPHTAIGIAAVHTGFNVANTLLFLPFTGYLARFLQRVVPDRKKIEAPRLTFLDVRMFDTPSIAIEQSDKEIIRMGQRTQDMMADLKIVLDSPIPETAVVERVFQGERDLDVVQKEVVEFISQIMAGNISHDISDDGSDQIRMADEYESISDVIVTILKLRLKMDSSELGMSPEAKTDIDALHAMVSTFLTLVAEMVRTDDNTQLTEAKTKASTITRFVKDSRARHLTRVESGEDPPLKSLIYTDMLSAYRRIKDHAYNIAEVMAGEK